MTTAVKPGLPFCLILVFIYSVYTCEDNPDYTNGGPCSQLVTEATKKECYTADVETNCCASCASVNTGNPGCEYGDRIDQCFVFFCPTYTDPFTCCGTCNTSNTAVSTPTAAPTTTTTPLTTTAVPTTTTTVSTTTTAVPIATTAVPTTTTAVLTTATTVSTTTTAVPITTTAVPITTTAVPTVTTIAPVKTDAVQTSTTTAVPTTTNAVPTTTAVPETTTAAPITTIAVPTTTMLVQTTTVDAASTTTTAVPATTTTTAAPVTTTVVQQTTTAVPTISTAVPATSSAQANSTLPTSMTVATTTASETNTTNTTASTNQTTYQPTSTRVNIADKSYMTETELAVIISSTLSGLVLFLVLVGLCAWILSLQKQRNRDIHRRRRLKESYEYVSPVYNNGGENSDEIYIPLEGPPELNTSTRFIPDSLPTAVPYNPYLYDNNRMSNPYGKHRPYHSSFHVSQIDEPENWWYSVPNLKLDLPRAWI